MKVQTNIKNENKNDYEEESIYILQIIILILLFREKRINEHFSGKSNKKENENLKYESNMEENGDNESYIDMEDNNYFIGQAEINIS